MSDEKPMTLQGAREIYGEMIESDLSEMSTEDLLESMIDHISGLETKAWLMETAVGYQLTVDETNRWMELVADELEKPSNEGLEISGELLEQLIESAKITN